MPADADDPDDAAVIQRSRQESGQFAELLRRHAPEIQRYVVRRLGRDAADDVVAETFLAAFRQRSGYDIGRADARPWLYGIATNMIARHRRSEVRQYRCWPAREPMPCRADPGSRTFDLLDNAAVGHGRIIVGTVGERTDRHDDASAGLDRADAARRAGSTWDKPRGRGRSRTACPIRRPPRASVRPSLYSSPRRKP